MTAKPSQRNSGRRLHRIFAAALCIAAALASRTAVAADQISVTLDQATVMKMPDKVSTVVVGNPLIADVTVQSGGILVITGKGYGTTNVVALDQTGKILMDRPVQVRGPRDGVIIVYRGADRESYNCSPNCEQRVTLGDAPKFFDATLNQTVTRNGQAASQK
jgi:Flp pilus assembly secretin CpaC